MSRDNSPAAEVGLPSVRMRTAVLFCLALAVISFSGCAAMAPEDRDFYYRHWTHPSSMDDPQERAEDADFSRRFWRGQ